MWIYLSPHFDDAILSCGGLIWQQAQGGQRVEIWTVCAGEIPPGPLSPFAEELHVRWGAGLQPVAARRAEDETACRQVGAAPRTFSLPDCIYRRLPGSGAPLVNRVDDLWQPIAPAEAPLVTQIGNWLQAGLAAAPRQARLVAPLAVGGHVDHSLARRAAEQLGRPLWYYADYPYAERDGFAPGQWLGKGYRVHSRPIPAAGLAAWQAAVAAYISQISSFWGSPDEMRGAIAAYAQTPPGHSLWKHG